MEGGIHAWKGLVAKGPPEAGMAFFPPGATGEELTALAWVLEDGSAFFYGSLAKQHPASPLFAELAGAEENHKRTLLQAYREIFGGAAEASFPGSILPAQGGEKTMEGFVHSASGYLIFIVAFFLLLGTATLLGLGKGSPKEGGHE